MGFRFGGGVLLRSVLLNKVLLLGITFFWLVEIAFSQGRLLGRVVDGSGNPLAAATVYLSSGTTTQAALSNADGYYIFLSVPEGQYTLKAFKRGLPKMDAISVTIAANTTTRKDFVLSESGGTVTLLASSKPKEKLAEKPVALAEKPAEKSTEKSAAPIAAVTKPKEEKAAPEPAAKAAPAAVAVDEDEDIQRITAEAEALVAELNTISVEKEVQIQGGIESVMKKIVYPEAALSLKIEGKVVARVFVDAKGNVMKIDVLKPAHPLLTEEAVRVLTEETLYTPAQAGGKPVAGAITVPLTFKIQKVTW
ncbi:MAG: TonB family protein [Chloroherpetonaceae bacterium]|nr:TonB family protein [Chloroherpetonaceae bacterium]MCS7211570.1 TonB family protein [Chloroherpetonaceae bacterium]MDW8019769.1 TonB family protein [Chloroherpetonaceae bacterium]